MLLFGLDLTACKARSHRFGKPTARSAFVLLELRLPTISRRSSNIAASVLLIGHSLTFVFIGPRHAHGPVPVNVAPLARGLLASSNWLGSRAGQRKDCECVLLFVLAVAVLNNNSAHGPIAKEFGPF